MANTADMLRLMRHAADLLDTCDPMADVVEIRSVTFDHDAIAAVTDRAVAEAAAVATARTVLRMVAAAMDDALTTAPEEHCT